MPFFLKKNRILKIYTFNVTHCMKIEGFTLHFTNLRNCKACTDRDAALTFACLFFFFLCALLVREREREKCNY